MNDTIEKTINYDYVTIEENGSMKFDYMMFINNLLMLGLTMAMAYISKKFEKDVENKQSHREIKMRKLDGFH